MDAPDLPRRRKSLKERLGLPGGCCGGCGPTWGFRTNTTSVLDDDDEVDYVEILPQQQLPPEQQLQQPLGREDQRSDPGMNLAAALAVERQYRALQEGDSPWLSPPGTPLMSLLEEAEGGGGGGGGGEVEGSEWGCCCVCMGRRKGSAFIPCGHTFCRVCSRELWLNRGTCPLCNRPILEILDIF